MKKILQNLKARKEKFWELYDAFEQAYPNKPTLYRFVPNNYTVQYKGNGSTAGSVTSQGATYDKPFRLIKNNYTKLGYIFTGWNTKRDGSGIRYKAGQKVKNLTDENNGTVTLYAQWSSV